MARFHTETIKVHSFEHMRNGSGGSSFYTILFTSPDNPKDPMLAISFESRENPEHNGEIAFLNVNLLAQGKILFPDNSFRYEFFYKEIQRVIKEYEESGYKSKMHNTLREDYTPPSMVDWIKMLSHPVRD